MQSDIIAAAEIKSFFESFPTRVFWPSDLVQLCRRYKMAWRVPRRAKSLLCDKLRAGSALWHKITFEQGSAALRALSIGPLFFFSRRD